MGVDIFQSTLPRRERLLVWDRLLRLLYFNPRSREGSDCLEHLKLLNGPQFQSTLPRRERPQTQSYLSKVFYFNPRSREGSD